MATRTVGARVAIDGEKEYKQALSELNTANATLRTEMQKLQAEYKGQEQSTEYLSKKSDILERQLLSQKDKVEKLREAVSNAAKQYGEADTRTQKYIQQLNKAEAEQFNLEHQLKDTTEAMEDQGEEMVGLGDTVTDLGEKFGVRLPAGVKDALNSVQGFSAGTVAAMAAAAAAVVAVIEVFKQLQNITLEVAASVDETLAQSEITGVPTEMLQAWDYAAPLIDVDASTITGAMTKITKAMGDAASGNESAMASFTDLGVSITDANGQLRSAQDVFMDVIDALGEIDNQTQRDAAAMSLMGKSAQELNPLINAGSGALAGFAEEAENVGYILSGEQLEALGEVDDAYQRMQLTIDAFKKQLAADFAPAAKAAMELFSDVVKKAGEFLQRSGLIENLANIFTTLVDIIRTVGEFLTSMPGIGAALDILNAALKGVALIFATIADTIKVIVGLLPTMWGSGMLKEGLGFGENPSNIQRVLGTRDTSGNYYNPETGMWEGNWGRNAGGTDNWRGGLTWVGEGGPELVALPGGSQIHSAQESRNFGGNTFYITIDAKNVREFNDIVEMAYSAESESWMR